MSQTGASGERDLSRLLAGLEPTLDDEPYVFVTVPAAPAGVEPVATVEEAEGTTLVLRQGDANRLGLQYGFVAARITLGVHSALEAVGLTAAVSSALAGQGIGCNVVAGFFHDHLFVPYDRAAEAVAVLTHLASRRRADAVE